ncbi:uncharacterized protein [Antedon mediterranea]|uniref:uncharacterized protein isoform X2 n=1 Tax=Antedon mediterranea TaxID=105859 RepID=UPI003AF4F4A7
MSGVELKVCDGEAKSNILLPIGKTVIGRGPFLSVADKRVSRNHAILEVDDGKLKIMSTHTNPTFCLEDSGENLSPLPKNSWHNLGHGDRFSLLPDQHIYEVVIDDRPINKDSQGLTLNTTASPIKNKEEKVETEEDIKNEEEEKEEEETKKNGESSELQDDKSNIEQKETESEKEDEKEQDQSEEAQQKEDENVVVLPSGKSVALPVNKQRNLPTWMLGSDTAKESPKGRGRGRAKKTANSEEVTESTTPKPKAKGRGRGRGRPSSGTKPTPKKAPKRDIEYLDDWMGSDDDDDDDDEGSDWEEENKKEQAKRRGSQSRFPRSPTKKSPRKRSSRRTSSDEEIDDLMDEEVYIPRPTKRGRNASRSSYSQSVEEDEDYEEEVVKKKKVVKRGKPKEDVSDEEKERTPCSYGSKCFRKNKQHFKEYKHSKKEENKRPRRQAADQAAKKIVDDNDDEEEDEDAPNTYDRNDSFLADSEATPQEAASEGSDYNPEEDSEDVKTLVKEAKGFIKNKKMQKKVH